MGEGLQYSKSSGGLIYYGGGLLYDTGLKSIGPIAPHWAPSLKGHRAGVTYSRLFKYPKHTADFTDNSIDPVRINTGSDNNHNYNVSIVLCFTETHNVINCYLCPSFRPRFPQ